VAGIGLYRAGTTGSGYLVVSNQNASRFVVFDRDGSTYRGSFVIGASGSIDKVNQTDGVAVVNVPMGSSFPQGMLVTQDGKDATRAEATSSSPAGPTSQVTGEVRVPVTRRARVDRALAVDDGPALTEPCQLVHQRRCCRCPDGHHASRALSGIATMDTAKATAPSRCFLRITKFFGVGRMRGVTARG